MKKKLLTGIMAAEMILGAVSAFADTSTNDEPPIVGIPEITINGENVDLSSLQVESYIFGDGENVMVPIRAVAEKMGLSVDWNGEDQSVSVYDNDFEVRIYIGTDSYTGVSRTAIGMTAPQSYGSAPQLVDSTTYVPAKMFELFGYYYTSVGQFVDFSNTTKNSENITQIPAPFTDFDSIEGLNEMVGYIVSGIKEIPFDFLSAAYIGFDDGLAEIIYNIDDDSEITFRQSKGSEDNSGVYTEYPQIKKITVSNFAVTIKGENDKYSLALWENDGYSFSISITKPIDETELITMIGSVR